jgi:uncharacterized peroxidase-related enzyme
MALLPYPERVSDDARDMIERFAIEHGRPSLLRRMLAWYPPALAAVDATYHPVMTGGQLPRATKELLLAAAADARRCRYCAGGHSRYLVRTVGIDQSAVEAMRSADDDADLDAADRAMVEFARKIATTPERTTPSDIAALEQVGLTTETIVEVVAVAMLAASTTTLALALHLEDDLHEPEFNDYF